MFSSFRRLVADIQMVLGPRVGDMGTLGDDDASPKQAAVRLALQFVLTAMILGVSVYIVRDPNATKESVNLAHTGFGAILGYWFR